MVRRLEEILRVPIVIITTRSGHDRYASDDSMMGNLDDVLIRESERNLYRRNITKHIVYVLKDVLKHILAFTFSNI